MKHTIFGIALAAIAIMALSATLTLSGRSVRKNELETAVNTAAKQALAQQGGQEGAPRDAKELSADFNRELLILLESDADVKVNVLSADTEKGILDVEVTETYRNVMGKEEKVSCRKSVIMETYSEMRPYHKVTFLVDGGVYDGYSIYEGEGLVFPEDPSPPRRSFLRWKKQGNPGLEVEEGMEILEDAVFEAEFR